MGQALEGLEPRIYVACLTAYNQGLLHGAWISIGDELSVVQEAISAMLLASPVPGAEEFAFHDYEGFGGAKVGEHAAIGEVMAIGALVREHGALGASVLDHFGSDLEAAVGALDDCYHGLFSNVAVCFQELTEETTTIPEGLRHYIDYAAMARDAVLSGEIFTIETAHDEVHVFWSR
jgi:antirestriction protein